MNYRIKILTDGKFLRYATTEEMETLRPKAGGTGVEKFSVTPTDKWSYRITLTDVSDTHQVEYGGKYFMEGNLYKAKYLIRVDDESKDSWITKGDILECIEVEGVFSLENKDEDFIDNWGLVEIDHMLISQWNDLFECIGNVNENPELL